jgi:hypothetical protein
MKAVLVVSLTLAVGSLASAPRTVDAQSAARGSAACAPADDLNFVCGLVNVEDFLPIEGGRWLVGGSLKVGSVGLYLIDTAAKTAKPVALSIASEPDPIYVGCAAPSLKGLSTHGLDVVPGHAGISTVYAVNHGGRDSVEVFRLNAEQATAEWIGCEVLPEGFDGNAVAALPKGSFVVTKFTDPRDKQAFQKVLTGELNGVVYRWTPGKGFSEVPGTHLSGDNGIAASPDGQWLFVNAYGTREVYRVPLGSKGERTSVKVDFNPDNLRWAPDGTLLVTGQFLNPKKLQGLHGWAAVKLDPKTMVVTPLIKEPGRRQFDDATSTVQVGQTLWFGTFRGDRVAYRSVP